MPSKIPPATSCCVASISLRLGRGSPDGWLCATITLAARSFSGPAKTSRGCTSEDVSVPIVTTRRTMRRFPLSKDKQRIYSCFLVRMNLRCGRMSSVLASGLALSIHHHHAIFWHPTCQYMKLFAFEAVGYIDYPTIGRRTYKIISYRKGYVCFKHVFRGFRRKP